MPEKTWLWKDKLQYLYSKGSAERHYLRKMICLTNDFENAWYVQVLYKDSLVWIFSRNNRKSQLKKERAGPMENNKIYIIFMLNGFGKSILEYTWAKAGR